MVGVTKIQRGNAGYWLAAVAEGGDDYYTKPGEAPGEWVGDLADELGLHGLVDGEGYGAVLEGRDPTTGAELVNRPETRFRHKADGGVKRVEPVLGYDVRFSAPKSVSLLYALGSRRTRERIVAVMNEAVRQGIAHLERQACMVQRGKGGAHLEPGRGFVGMAFRHRMSRAGDPALHVHVVISNLTRALSDGKWLSLASPKGRSPLFPHAKSAGVVFQAALRAGILREFGLEFTTVTNGYADLKGFSRELIDAFSTRSREIADWLERHGASSVKAAQTAAYRTRKAKDHTIDADARIAEWEAQAAPLGFSRREAEQMLSTARPREPEAVTEEVIRNAVRKLEATSSTFDRRELLWAVAEQLPEGADLDALSAAVDRILASDLVLHVYSSSGPLDSDAYTTPAIARAERSFIDGALRTTEAGAAVVDQATLASVLACHDYLGADQREMALRLTAGGEQVSVVAAWPGTGKTTALRATAEAWRQAGFQVIGCATARTATGELIDAGVSPSFSIASLRLQAKGWHTEGRRLRDGTVIIVDEANVTSTFDLEALRCLVAECGGKLVLIGDPRQIGSIGPGGLYVHLARLSEPIVLKTIRRQHREIDRRLVTLVHEGRGSEALDLLRTEGKLIVGDDLPSTLHGLLLDWHRDFAGGGDVVMIARRNRDVDDLNEGARELRLREGRLGASEVIVGERPIAAGDRVQTRINWNRPRVDNRERWDVLSADATARTLTLRRVGGDERTVTLGPRYLDCTTLDGAPSVEHAYAISKFGAESKTFDRAYPLLDHGSSLNEELVALSRGREVANVYAVASPELLDPELGPGRREVSDLLQDLRGSIERAGGDPAAVEASVRKEVEAMLPHELADRRAMIEATARAFDPAARRLDRLDRQIAREEGELRRLIVQREAVEGLPGTPPAELRRLRNVEFATAERLRQSREERAGLPDSAAAEQPRPVSAEDRLQAAIIDERISRLASRELAAARAGESAPVYRALGSYPEEPALAVEWDGAAHALVIYRLRHNVRDPENPLGREPKSPAARAEHARTRQRIEMARRQLHQQERDPHREAAHEVELSM